jgi:aminopeptidase
MFQTIDPRDRELARLLVHHSVRARQSDLVYIQCIGADTLGLGAALVEEVTAVGAAPYLQFTEPEIQRAYIAATGRESLARLAEFEAVQMKNTTCYIGIRGGDNVFETADVPQEKMDAYRSILYRPVHLELRVKKTRWCVLRYPNSSMAQLSKTSRAGFADFYYKVCCVDYAQMDRAVQPLKALMEKTDAVHIKGAGTDLRFSIKDIPVVPCTGSHNIPDGECFTAPVKDSINGVIRYNAPTVESGFGFEDITLTFKDGKIVDAKAADAAQTKKLNEVLDQDPGARFVGEFAVGFNPHILHPMRDILFDEKIAGSIHMAMGQCYEDASNGNDSALHWDLVHIQRPDYGGGELWFDNTLVRKDGLFVVDALKGLNPEAFG